MVKIIGLYKYLLLIQGRTSHRTRMNTVLGYLFSYSILIIVVRLIVSIYQIYALTSKYEIRNLLSNLFIQQLILLLPFLVFNVSRIEVKLIDNHLIRRSNLGKVEILNLFILLLLRRPLLLLFSLILFPFTIISNLSQIMVWSSFALILAVGLTIIIRKYPLPLNTSIWFEILFLVLLVSSNLEPRIIDNEWIVYSNIISIYEFGSLNGCLYLGLSIFCSGIFWLLTWHIKIIKILSVNPIIKLYNLFLPYSIRIILLLLQITILSQFKIYQEYIWVIVLIPSISIVGLWILFIVKIDFQSNRFKPVAGNFVDICNMTITALKSHLLFFLISSTISIYYILDTII